MRKIFKKIAFAMIISLSVFALASCGAETENGNTDDSNVTTTSRTDGSFELPAAMNIDKADGKILIPCGGVEASAVAWESSKESVATVDEEGFIKGEATGTATITGTYDGKELTFKVTVTKTYGTYTVISTVDEFLAIEDWSSSAKYCLGADIDFENAEVEPLGGWDNPDLVFDGIFDGRGYALMNFTITDPESCFAGTDAFGVSLFPHLTGTVRNLNIINAEFTGFGFTGGIAGLVDGTVENCYFKGKITATEGWTSTVPAGGICGILGGGGKVKNCFIDAEIVGGFVFAGFNFGAGEACYAVSESIGDTPNDDGEYDLMFQIDQTTNPDETPALKQFTDSERLELTQLDDLDNFPEIGTRWTISDGSRPYLKRVDGLVPDWSALE